MQRSQLILKLIAVLDFSKWGIFLFSKYAFVWRFEAKQSLKYKPENYRSSINIFPSLQLKFQENRRTQRIEVEELALPSSLISLIEFGISNQCFREEIQAKSPPQSAKLPAINWNSSTTRELKKQRNLNRNPNVIRISSTTVDVSNWWASDQIQRCRPSLLLWQRNRRMRIGRGCPLIRGDQVITWPIGTNHPMVAHLTAFFRVLSLAFELPPSGSNWRRFHRIKTLCLSGKRLISGITETARQRKGDSARYRWGNRYRGLVKEWRGRP